MKLCITGGGTGGHLMIAQALVEALLKEGDEAIFIGSTSGQDRGYFSQNTQFSQLYFLETTGVVNQKGMGKLKALWRVFLSFLNARKILKKHGVEATYSVGGFSAAPASFASLFNQIPLFIHEQNAINGRLNSILKPFAKRFISAYDRESPIKGYPVKEIFYSSARVRKNIKTIIFLGGSYGARAINDLALSVASQLKAKGIKIIHQAGESDLTRVRDAYRYLNVEVELYGFTKDLASLMARADLAVSRAGASTLWEATTNGLPALYLPYPYAAGDHQYHNARFIVENELGWCMRESEELRAKLLSILEEDLETKSMALLKYSIKDVAIKMIKDIKKGIND